MKKIKQEIESFVLEDKDLNTIKQCLNYCCHRLRNHKTGITGFVDVKEIDRLRRELGII